MVITILFTTFILATIDTGMAFAQTDTLRLNEFKKVYLEGVEVKTYYFTPNSDGYFVAETTGNLDTRLKISSSSGLFIINDDGGINNNSRIYFKAEKGVQITIDVRLYEDYSSDDASSGYIELQLRKQRFSMFSYVDVNGNNLIENLEKPNSLFKNLFECSKYENEHASIANSFDSTNISVVNSEIMFFYGHGYSDGRGVVFYDHSVNRGSWTLDSFINLNRTRVAVWAACDSANSSNSRNISFAENSVINWGASSAVGFEKTVSISSASKFTDKFFEKLASGATVDESAKAGAGAVFWAWDAVKSYKVFGYGGFSVLDNTYNDGTFSLRPDAQVNSDDCFNEDEFSLNYKREKLDNNTFRYYELINGYESNNIIDITRLNGKIIKSNDLRKDYYNVLPINDNYLTLSATEHISLNNVEYKLLQEKDEHIVYCNFQGDMTPIKITYCIYKNKNGTSIIEADCINLNNGERVNYSDINGI